VVAVSGLLALLAGCESTPSASERSFHDQSSAVGTNSPSVEGTNVTQVLRAATDVDIIEVGEALYVQFLDTPTVITPSSERVKSDGTVTLIHNQIFVAAGKHRGDLEKEIRDRYVPSYYKNLTVTIQLPQRFYWVEGDVRFPSKQEYSGKTTVLKAIATAQGFTEFARKSKVRLTRGGETYVIDCEAAQKKPRLDMEVLPGDKIFVPRRVI
jgi:protein involved in polysaccharide export with SLBB domain